MVSRLVLGFGSVGHDLLERAPRAETVAVVSTDESRVQSLRDRDVDATEADPADPANYPESVDVVVVASDDPDGNLRATRSAREAFPDALFVVYAGRDADEETVAELRTLADDVVDPVESLCERVLDVAAGPAGDRTRRLRQVLQDAAGPLAVVTHDNPDPDAIASALALSRLAQSVGVEADACYYGEISHQENRALVNLLDIPLIHLGEGDIDAYGSVALVDHSRPGVNDSLPAETTVDIVVDHHPPRAPVEGKFVDLRSDVGATSTLLCEYLQRFGLTPTEQVATALLYGIRVDTRDFTREVSEKDFEAAAYLLPTVDQSTLDRVETPSVSAETLSTVARAIKRRIVRDGALTTCVGDINDRDALAQAAERLLDMEGVHTTIVYGFMEGTVYISGRTRGADLDLGETMRDAFGQIGSAGGHADMAGAQIPLGILADVEEGSKETLATVVEDIISERFYDALAEAPTAPVPDEELTYEYSEEESTSLVTASAMGQERGEESEAEEESRVGEGSESTAETTSGEAGESGSGHANPE